MLVDKLWMWKKYREFSQTMFNGDMPSLSEITFEVNQKANRWGYACHKYNTRTIEDDGYPRRYDYEIHMSNAYDSPEHVKETTMIHEMIHIYDYYNHPEHFVQHTWKGWKLRKDYDAHGSYFMSIAKRIKDDFGYDIQKNVTEEEQAQSTMSDKLSKRLENKAQKGYVIGYQKFNPNHHVYYNGRLQEGMMFKCGSVNILKKIMSNYKDADIRAYLTHDEKYKNYAGCMQWIRGWYMSEKEWNELVDGLADKASVLEAEPKAIAESLIVDTIKNLVDKLVDGGKAEAEQINDHIIQIAVI